MSSATNLPQTHTGSTVDFLVYIQCHCTWRKWRYSKDSCLSICHWNNETQRRGNFSGVSLREKEGKEKCLTWLPEERFHTDLTTCQTTSQAEAEALMSQWWAGPHFDWHCLHVHILCSLFKLWSHFWIPEMDLRSLLDLCPSSRYGHIWWQPLFCFWLLTLAIWLFNWLTGTGWLKVVWGTGCKPQVQ